MLSKNQTSNCKTCSGWMGWLVVRPVGRLVGWSVSYSVGRLVGLFFGLFINWLVGWLVGWCGRLVLLICLAPGSFNGWGDLVSCLVWLLSCTVRFLAGWEG